MHMLQCRMIRIPAPLRPGDLIAVPAPSSGVTGAQTARLDAALTHLTELGYRVVEGCNLRSQHKDASASAMHRTEELLGFLHDPEVAAIIPPWGGELASELLDHLDFARLRVAQPKWLLGYSDISTLLMPLTLLAGWATAHGSNLLQLTPANADPLTSSVLDILATPAGTPTTQHASTRFQPCDPDYRTNPLAGFALIKPTRWKRLDANSTQAVCKGRLIGGCLDTVAWLAGTPYGDIPGFIRTHRNDGTILYLENVEMTPPTLLRALLSLRRQGWFNGLSGLLFGRSAAADAGSPNQLTYLDALQAACADLPFPVIHDVDIGHQPPQLTLLNGALARIEYSDGGGTVTQTLAP